MNLKRILISIILTISILSSFAQADGSIIKDIGSSSEYAKNSISALAQSNIIKGDENGNYNPQKTITRGEMITLLVRVLELDTNAVPQKATFTDVPKGHWANKYVEAAYSQGIIKGVEPTKFGIDDICTREQIAVMAVRALKILEDSDVVVYQNTNKLADKAQIADWAKREVETAMEAGIMNGTALDIFNAKQLANKEQAAVIIDRFITNKEQIIEKFAQKRDIKYPELYKAMAKNYDTDYKGEIEAVIDINERNEGLEEFVNMKYSLYSKVNGSNAALNMSIDISGNGLESEVLEFEEIITSDKYYVKDSTDNMWIEIEGIYGDGAIGGFVYSPLGIESEENGMVINNGFYEYYNKLPITQEGTVNIAGKTASKYVMSFDSTNIGYLFPDYELDEIKEFIETEFSSSLNYVYEFYVADEQIIRQTFSFGGQTYDASGEYPVDVAVNMVIDYKNIGKEFQITAPDASMIKPLDFEY